jgi:purine nucleosidase
MNTFTRSSKSALILALVLAGGALARASAAEKIIIDTDIGGDIDDAFAVALALRSPEVKLLGITTASGDTEARARILDRMLGEAGRVDIPVAVGIPTTLPWGPAQIGAQTKYGQHAGAYARATHPRAVDFILEQIRHDPGQITLVTIGPLTNIAAAIDKDRDTFRKVKRVVMMGGSIRSGYAQPDDPKNLPTAETNIFVDIPASKKVFESGVPLYVIPTDATAQLKLDEVKRSVLFTYGTPLTSSLAVLYFMWGGVTPILWDPMALAFAIQPQLCPVEPLRIVVDDKGFTREVAGQSNAQVCLHSDPEAFFRFYMGRFP